jgi:hypothetical protein
LTVPRIYFEAEWPLAASPVDVLAIDRDGVGDAHVVEIRQTAADALRETERLLTTSAPFRWIAFPRGSEDEASLLAILSERGLFIAGSPGRVGIIEIAQIASGDLGANVRLAAERFPDAVYEVATRFSGSHKAHIQFGD